MNKTIENLALQCEFDVGQIMAEVLCPEGEDLDIIQTEWNNLSKETRHFIFSTLEERQEKFAELIIKECTKKCDAISSFTHNKNPKAYEASTSIKHNILEHFGITE